jgi:large subunit ribosomal protein L22
MKAHARSIRIAPKKAAIVAQMVRGMPVNQALDSLRRTHKKAARVIEQLVASAAANAEHNDQQDRSLLVIRTIMVNQGAAYSRGVPMARGRMRPMQKFLSHISVVLGIAEATQDTGAKTTSAQTSSKKGKESSQKADSAVKPTVAPKRSSKKSGASSPDSSS